MTITEAIRQVLAQKSKPMTAIEIYEAIVKASLFEFKSTSAASIVRSQIRRHCEGIQAQSASATKYFRLVGSNRYELLDSARKS
jgi:restriction system protein